MVGLVGLGLVCFLLGFLLAQNTWLTEERRQSRRDLRLIYNLRSELERHVELLRAEKKRSGRLLGDLRRWRAQALKSRDVFGELVDGAFGCRECGSKAVAVPGVLCDVCVAKRAKEVEAAVPIIRMMCEECGEPATTNVGGSVYCKDCLQEVSP